MDNTPDDRIAALAVEHADRLDERRKSAPSKEAWASLRATGTELWLDTGDIEVADELWCAEFSGLTTNNSSLNAEVQKGIYDDLISDAGHRLGRLLDPAEAAREIAFVLNAVHGLRLARRFGCTVSVELHTDMMDDVEGSLQFARRYHWISPEHFAIKVPLTASGLIAARILHEEGIPVNLTVGFSARQNFLAAALARPAFVNVFVARITSFIEGNGLGRGIDTAVRAALASQRAVSEVDAGLNLNVRQIMASMRAVDFLPALAGVDIQTLNPAIAREFEALTADDRRITPCLDACPEPDVAPHVDINAVGLPALWDVSAEFKDAVSALAGADASSLSADAVRDHFRARGFGGLLPEWSAGDREVAREDGKIPRLARWQERLASGRIGLDALMNLSVRMAFATDQEAMDQRILGLIG